MNAIIGFANLLNEPGITKKTMDSYIEIITSKGNSLLKIINDIIDISKIEANEMEINKRELQFKRSYGRTPYRLFKDIKEIQERKYCLKINPTQK